MQNKTEHYEYIEFIYNEYYSVLSNFLLRYTKDRQQIEDIIQDVFTNLLSKPDLTLHLNQIKHFLMKSVKNRYIDFYRKKKPAYFGECKFFEDKAEATSFEKKLELTEMIQQALNKMPAQQKFVMLAKDYMGYSYQEIANFTGGTCGSVKTRVCRSRRLFISHYKKQQLHQTV